MSGITVLGTAGVAVGALVGFFVGTEVGAEDLVGAADGALVGALVGTFVGVGDGNSPIFATKSVIFTDELFTGICVLAVGSDFKTVRFLSGSVVDTHSYSTFTVWNPSSLSSRTICFLAS